MKGRKRTMSEKKGWGSSVMGLFVVRDEKADEPAEPGAPDSAGSPGAEDATTGAAAAPPAGTDFVREPPAAPGGKVDFPAVYAAAGIDDEEQARVAKAAELISSLPAGTDSRRIVEASLKAFGVPVDKIIAAGDKEIRALDAYVATGAADTRKVLAESQQRIAQYEQEIQRIRQVMDQRVAEQQGVERACEGGKLEVARVLEFFGHAPAGAAPKPVDPSERRT
jgi:hypothetical protein